MEISQDPITGVYQTSDQFWSRVADAYEAGKMQVGTNLQRNLFSVEFKLLKRQQTNCMHASSNVKADVQVVLQMMIFLSKPN